MPYPAYIINVLIACPSDVVDEKKAILRAIDDWNVVHGPDTKLIALPMNWETHVAPQMGGSPQTIINKDLVDRCDVLVAVFRTRIGTPTNEAEGGTVEEIQKHTKAKKPAMVYFSKGLANIGEINTAQLDALRKFQDRISDHGVLCEYESIQVFCDKFGNHLAQTILREYGNLRVSAAPPATELNPLEDLEQLMPDVLEDLRKSLREYPIMRDIIWVRTRGIAYNWPTPHLRFSDDVDPGIRDKLNVLANQGLLKVHNPDEDFAYKMTEDFVRMLRKSQTRDIPILKLEAKKLLVRLSQDPAGEIVHVRGLVQVCGKTVNIPNDARDEAKWEAAIEQLVQLHLVTANADSEYFRMTDEGYERANKLKTDSELLEHWPELALSNDCKQLLIAGVDGNRGIIISKTMNWKVVHAGDQAFGDPKSDADFARWKYAVEQLAASEFIEPHGTDGLFGITHIGYQAVERMR